MLNIQSYYDFYSKYLHTTNICSIFVLSKNNENMKQKKEMMEVTPEERELLERMRNYNKSYPNGYPQLLWDLQEFFDKMVRQPYE